MGVGEKMCLAHYQHADRSRALTRRLSLIDLEDVTELAFGIDQRRRRSSRRRRRATIRAHDHGRCVRTMGGPSPAKFRCRSISRW